MFGGRLHRELMGQKDLGDTSSRRNYQNWFFTWLSTSFSSCLISKGIQRKFWALGKNDELSELVEHKERGCIKSPFTS
jgi:hypothetical protein